MNARDLDHHDPIAPFRARFCVHDPDLIYLDGNSLGRLPVAVPETLRATIDHEWGDRLVWGWGVLLDATRA